MNLEAGHPCGYNVPVCDRAVVPLDQSHVPVLRDDDDEGVVHFTAETIGSAVAGADLCNGFLLCEASFCIEGVGNSIRLLDVT